MDYHLERGLRLHEPQDNNLYNWAINEIDAQGRIGRDQIPWDWTLYFTATSCALGDSIDIKSQFQGEETKPALKIAQHQSIRVQLRPGSPRDDENFFRRTTFSMFGTDRAINSFQLEIYPIADPAGEESCTAWGTVSYTAETDFREETIEDCIVFSLFVKPETFARYAAKISHGSVDEMFLSVGRVAGFYSEWSPSISTGKVKVLTNGRAQKIILPPGLQFEPPRLGDVGAAALSINRRLEFGKRAPDPVAVRETALVGTMRVAPDANSGGGGTAQVADAGVPANGSAKAAEAAEIASGTRVVRRIPSGTSLRRDTVEALAQSGRLYPVTAFSGAAQSAAARSCRAHRAGGRQLPQRKLLDATVITSAYALHPPQHVA